MADDGDATTAYTTKGIPSGMWEEWKGLVAGNELLGDRIIRLLAADLAVSRERGMGRLGLLEIAQQEGIVTDEQMREALETQLDEDDEGADD